MEEKKDLSKVYIVKTLFIELLILIISLGMIFLSTYCNYLSAIDKYVFWFIHISQVLYILVSLIAILKIIKIISKNVIHTSYSKLEDETDILVQHKEVLTNSTIRNISDQNELQQDTNIIKSEVFSSKEMFFDYIPLPLVVANKNGKILNSNSLANNFFKFSLVNKNISSFIIPLKSVVLEECTMVNVKILLNDNKSIHSNVFQTSIYNEDNDIKFVIIIILPANNLVVKTSDSYIPKNEIKKAASMIENDEILNLISMALMIVDENQKITFLNNSFLQLITNNSIYSDISNTAQNLIGTEFVNLIKNIFTEEQINKILFTEVGTFKLNLKGSVYLEVTFKSVNSNILLTILDVSDKRTLELQNSFSQRLQTIGQIASAVAHDFNNLLTAIMSFTFFLKERYSEDDPSSVELEQIEQNSNRAKVMIRQLLTFSRGKELNPVEFVVNSEISNLMSTILRLMGERIKTEFIRGRNIGKITMDTVQFQQIIINLVVNARDAMKNGGKLIISTNTVILQQPVASVITTIPAGNYILISIKDQGEGIKKENFKKIFQTHFSTKGEKGNGLGLSTVAKIMEENAGFISLESVVNEGTTFNLYFSAQKSSAEQANVFKKIDNKESAQLKLVLSEDTKKEVKLDLTGSETILLVEDEIPVRTVCKRALVSKGYTVIEAEDAETALTLLQNLTNNVDLVISDVMMPGISGLQFIHEARKIKPDIKAILMSGYAEDALEDNHYALESIEFLAKPFSPDVLATKVKKVIIS